MIDLKKVKNNILKKESFYCLAIILTIFFLDRYSKLEIIKNFSDNTFFLNNFINLDLVWNTGIGFGLLSSDSNFIYNLTTFTIFAVISSLVYFMIISEIYEKTIFALIIGGALGNFYDRIAFKAVPDFIDIHFYEFHWFTFNFADIFITIGIGLYIFKDIFKKEHEKLN